MKRFFILASAAIVALASCAKTEVVNNNGPQEIAFKQLAGPITKAEQANVTLSGDMGVYALLNGTTNFYFQNAEFEAKQDATLWTGVTSYYWPLSGGLDFVVYAPYAAVANALPSYDPATKTLRVKADNSSHTTIADQTDYLYGAEYYSNANNENKGYDKTTASVPVILKHALAKVTLSFTGENVQVSNISLGNVRLSGTYSYNYANSTISWTDISDPVAVSMISPNTGEGALTENYVSLNSTATSASLLVVPFTASNITFKYKLGDNTTALEYVIDLSSVTWVSGTHYTYAVTITPKEIKIDPKVDTNWATGGDTITL